MADGKIVGYEPDLLRNICARVTLTCNRVVQDPAQTLAMKGFGFDVAPR